VSQDGVASIAGGLLTEVVGLCVDMLPGSMWGIGQNLYMRGVSHGQYAGMFCYGLQCGDTLWVVVTVMCPVVVRL